MINHKNGKTGEDIAADFFEANGYTVLHRNYRSGHLETDLIVENFESVAFVEVKTRTGDMYGIPAEAVTFAKQDKIRKTAQMYMACATEDLQPRFDVAEVHASCKGNKYKVESISIIEDAF